MTNQASSVSGCVILLVGGSRRANSVNAAVLKTAGTLIPANAEALIYGGLSNLPHFNPDLDRDPLPEPVAHLRAQLRRADAVLFSTPEYASSLPGSFKNLLDWTIGGGDGRLYRLPVGWVNPSAHGGAKGAYQALHTVLTMAGADILGPACVNVPVPRDAIAADGLIADAAIRTIIGGAARALVDCVAERRSV
jgi:chromate reductase